MYRNPKRVVRFTTTPSIHHNTIHHGQSASTAIRTQTPRPDPKPKETRNPATSSARVKRRPSPGLRSSQSGSSSFLLCLNFAARGNRTGRRLSLGPDLQAGAGVGVRAFRVCCVCVLGVTVPFWSEGINTRGKLWEGKDGRRCSSATRRSTLC